MRRSLVDVARCALGVLAAAVLAGPLVALAPEPDPLPQRWELDLEVGPMRLATVHDANGVAQAYWYLTFRVENNSGRDRFFVPAFDLATDEGEIVRAGRNVPGAVFTELLKRLDTPLLQSQFQAQDLLLQGEENARDVLVVWPATDLDADLYTVFFIGFSGENEAFYIPDPETKELHKFVTRKTYMVDYCVPGEIWNRGSRPFETCGARWVMR